VVGVTVGLPVSVGPPVAVGVPLPVGVPVPVGVPLPVEVPVAVVVGVMLRLAVGCGDFDADGEAFGDVLPRLTRVGTELAVVARGVALTEALCDCVGDDGGVIVVLLPILVVGPLLADSSTATIAMTPIAAAMMPA
jgi:hypothetical protein